MQLKPTSRILPILTLAALLTASGAFAQQGEPTPQARSGRMSGNMQMMAMHSQMMADMQAMDARLDQKVAVMNAAKGHAKVDATADVINEMVAQQKQMMAKMMGMHEQMMKGMKDMNGTSPGTHNEHHEDQN